MVEFGIFQRKFKQPIHCTLKKRKIVFGFVKKVYSFFFEKVLAINHYFGKLSPNPPYFNHFSREKRAEYEFLLDFRNPFNF